ncbi:unnamed protein product, partial [Meganyctiphanes norvegica]
MGSPSRRTLCLAGPIRKPTTGREHGFPSNSFAAAFFCPPGFSADSSTLNPSNLVLGLTSRETDDLAKKKKVMMALKHGLENSYPYSLSHCNCDEKLYNCLRDVGTTTANLIGNTFFTVIRTKCFKLDHPATCVRKSFWRRRCLEYEYDTNKSKIWQFFEPQNY